MAKQSITEQFDLLLTKLAQLEALLTATYGNSGESFDSMSELKRDNYLWACTDMAGDCAALAQRMRRKDRQACAMEEFDLLLAKLAQLATLLMATFGTNAESFNGMSERKRDNYLRVCGDTVQACDGLAQRLYGPVLWPAAQVPAAARGGEPA